MLLIDFLVSASAAHVPLRDARRSPVSDIPILHLDGEPISACCLARSRTATASASSAPSVSRSVK